MKHPAKFTDSILEEICSMIGPGDGELVLDPFAGTGKIHNPLLRLGYKTVGIEIEPEWANMHPNNIVGNVLSLPFKNESVELVITSPCYANRMADHHVAKDGSKRHTYTHYIGRQLHEDNSGKMQWGSEYRKFHSDAWTEVVRVLKKDGKFILNVANHIRKFEIQHVAEWHLSLLVNLGLTVTDMRIVNTPKLQHGENYEARVPGEYLILFSK